MSVRRSDPGLPSRCALGQRRRVTRSRNRRGFALALALVLVLAIGALATSALVLTSNASLLAKAAERQRELTYAAEAALNIGKSRLNQDPLVMPASGDTMIVTDATLYAADNTPIPGIKVSIWVGPTGSTSGQFGTFASVVARATDNRGSGFVRRLELVQESFAKFAYWSNSEQTPGGSIVYFDKGDQIFGPVWSNDVIHIGSNGGASFHDVVGTAATVVGAPNGTFAKGYQENQKVINLPSNAALAKLGGYATAAGYNFSPPTSGNASTVRQRIEFVATDIAGTGDSLAAQDGFFRVYTATTAAGPGWLRGDFPAGATAANVTECGDWHRVVGSPDQKFFPASVHAKAWFKRLDSLYLVSIGDVNANANATAEMNASLQTIMGHVGARCYLGGDPHLAAVERIPALYPDSTTRQIGGDNTTFTPVGANGSWSLYSATPDPSVSAKRPADAKYLFPLHRGFNPATKGVVYFGGTVGVSGTVRGRVTLYAKGGTIVVLDDVRYANDPARGVCFDILGLVADKDITVADNAVNTPQAPPPAGPYRSYDDTPDLFIHAVLMALNTSFSVENYMLGPTSALKCDFTTDGRGCLYLVGGVIQKNRDGVGTSTGSGFVKRYSYDRCAVTNPPPYFPTTGRLTDNRYFELGSVGFDATSLFRGLTPAAP